MDGTDFMDTILSLYGGSGVEAAHKYATDTRLGYKRELKDKREPEKPSVYPSKDEVEVAKKEVETCQSERNSLAGETMNNARMVWNLTSEVDQLKSADRPEMPIAPTSILIPLEQIQKSADSARELSESALKALDGWREEKDSNSIGDLPKTLEVMKGMGTRISEKSLKSVDDEISQKTQEITRLNEEGANLRDAYNDAHGIELDADKALIEAVNKNAEIKTAIENHERELANWQSSIDNAESAIKEKAAELSALQKSLNGLHVASIEASIQDIDSKIATSNDTINAAALVQRYEARIEEIAKEKDLLERKIKNWDKICDCLNPKNESLAALFSSGKEGFDELFRQINADLGLEVTLRADYTFMSKEYGNSDVMKRVSPSRQLRIGAALLIAICHQIGWKTVMIDWLDALYGNSKEDMIKVLLGLDEYGMNTLAFCAGPTAYAKDEWPSWIKYIRPVENGRLLGM